MNSSIELIRFLPWSRAIALTLVSVGIAGCSADSSRFGDAPYGGRGQGDTTGSIGQGAPVGHVETRSLPQSSQLPPPQNPAPVASAVVGGGGRGMASYSPPVASNNPPVAAATYNPPPSQSAYIPPPTPASYAPASYNSAPSPEFTGTVAPPPSVVRKPTPPGQWSWDGGIAITVAPGETVESIARRHGVPVAVIMDANKLPSPNAIQVGQRLVIPRYESPPPAAPQPSHAMAPAPAPAPAPVASKPVPAVAASASPHAAGPVNSGVHVVAPGDTLSKIARQYGKSVNEIVKANNILPTGKLNIGDRIIVPGARISAAKPEAEQAAATAKPTGNKIAAGAAPTQTASMVTPAADSPGTDTAAKAATEATPGFRWPVRGRIIAGFGPRPNGQQNDGIDVAVPENTPIKAAEDGVVAYAGSELKGYGNLVLVRHPNGYVTAYAHAKELLVKRGDPIKRGDVIAKSGQSGNVDAPQLHFEVRKGSAPVDPMQFLNGA